MTCASCRHHQPPYPKGMHAAHQCPDSACTSTTCRTSMAVARSQGAADENKRIASVIRAHAMECVDLGDNRGADALTELMTMLGMRL